VYRRGVSCDNWNFSASNPCLNVGGNYNQNANNGLFYVNNNSATNTNANIGCLLFSIIAKPQQLLAEHQHRQPRTTW
jgi:hypothetical protein